jgi:peptidoglycan/LPS O-acetylase OafA/YrhL
LNIYALTFTRLDPLALGALSALAFRTSVWRELFECDRIEAELGSVCGISHLCAGGLASRLEPEWLFCGSLVRDRRLLRRCARAGTMAARFVAPAIAAYGRYSYCIYVIHLLVIQHVKILSHRLSR